MSTRNEHDMQTDANASSEHGVAAEAHAAAMQRRRRFMKIGASAVPVSLTLSSRPVMAWHCNTTSAWGSAILLNGGASVKARAEAKQLQGTECWYLTNWVADTCTGTNLTVKPWTAAGKLAFASPKNTATYTKANLKISQIFPLGLTGVTSTDTVNAALARLASGDDYRAYLIAARLNALYAPNKDVAKCTVSNGTDMTQQMAKLGAGLFKPTNSTVAWTADNIKQYLKANWLA
ncbi:hypothetical protein [Paucibacter sp. Y2R2-4]|uniref:hypothetical protein n=1 Tax=Paucibacter sp. Y2R2-4 TaxID=2893553 RepID=UPI0021E46B88|nr:hypothetical protein [Paucibacter sp. Y2R2-4]MCV2350774.1 hypothetical protein [Paucibacter sp. Y2R2-4]